MKYLIALPAPVAPYSWITHIEVDEADVCMLRFRFASGLLVDGAFVRDENIVLQSLQIADTDAFIAWCEAGCPALTATGWNAEPSKPVRIDPEMGVLFDVRDMVKWGWMQRLGVLPLPPATEPEPEPEAV